MGCVSAHPFSPVLLERRDRRTTTGKATPAHDLRTQPESGGQNAQPHHEVQRRHRDRRPADRGRRFARRSSPRRRAGHLERHLSETTSNQVEDLLDVFFGDLLGEEHHRTASTSATSPTTGPATDPGTATDRQRDRQRLGQTATAPGTRPATATAPATTAAPATTSTSRPRSTSPERGQRQRDRQRLGQRRSDELGQLHRDDSSHGGQQLDETTTEDNDSRPDSAGARARKHAARWRCRRSARDCARRPGAAHRRSRADARR